MNPRTLEFGDVYVDIDRVVVERAGAPIDIEPKVFDLLCFLIEHRDRLITKDELLDGVWRDTFVTPNALTRAIAQLRKALGDDVEQPRYIETVSKRGYRFIAPVTVGGGAVGVEEPSVVTPPAAAPEPVPETKPAPATQPVPPRSRRKAVVSAAVVAAVSAVMALAVGLGVWAVRSARSDNGRGPTGALTPVRFSTRNGVSTQPSLSPDGSAMAYVSDRSGSREIYVAGLVRESREIALTTDGGVNVQPAWSPDGRWIAYHSNKRGGLWVIPATGGTPVQLAESGSGPAWSPDGSAIAFTSHEGASAGQSIIRVAQRDGSGVRDLTRIGAPAGAQRAPAWSRNGTFIAFTVTQGAVNNSVWIVQAAGGAPRVLDTPGASAYELQFGPEDRALFFRGYGDNNTLYREPFDAQNGTSAGPPEVVLSMPGQFDGLSITASGLLAYGLTTIDTNLWTVNLAPGGELGEPARLTNESVRIARPDYSPNGQRLTFGQIGGDNGNSTWVMNADGSERSLLVPAPSGVPMWHRDGSRVLLMRGPAGPDSTLWWVDLATRKTTPVANVGKGARNPRLSPDSREIAYWKTDPDGSLNSWTQSLDGGSPHRVTSDAEAINYPVWSPDGQWLAVGIKRGESTHVGVVSKNGGSVEQLTHATGQTAAHSWSPDGEHIAFAARRDGIGNIWEVSRRTKVSRQLTHFTSTNGGVLYPSWSPQGNRIAFEREIPESSIWTVQVQ